MEIMVALSLGLTLLLPLFRLLYQTLTSLGAEQDLARVQSRGRYLTMYLRRYLAHDHCLRLGRILSPGDSPSFVKAKMAKHSNSIVIPACDQAQGKGDDAKAYYVAQQQGHQGKMYNYHLYRKVKGHRAKVLVPSVYHLHACWRDKRSICRHKSAVTKGKQARGLHIDLVVRGRRLYVRNTTDVQQSAHQIRWPMEFAIEPNAHR